MAKPMVVKQWEVRSPSGHTYAVALHADGSLSCPCPAWRFVRHGARGCKHTEAIAGMRAAGEDPVSYSGVASWSFDANGDAIDGAPGFTVMKVMYPNGAPADWQDKPKAIQVPPARTRRKTRFGGLELEGGGRG